jgi:hypothetical protein
VDDEPALEGILTSRDTGNLVVHGQSLTVDAIALGVADVYPDHTSNHATTPFNAARLPGQHFLDTTGGTVSSFTSAAAARSITTQRWTASCPVGAQEGWYSGNRKREPKHRAGAACRAGPVRQASRTYFRRSGRSKEQATDRKRVRARPTWDPALTCLGSDNRVA